MRTVIETATYLNSVAGIWNTEEAEAFVSYIAAHPDDGDLMPGTRGLRKVRWAASGRDKRGGARVIYTHRSACGQVVLLIVYTKAKFDNLPQDFLKRLSELYDV